MYLDLPGHHGAQASSSDDAARRQVHTFLEYCQSTSWLRVFAVCALAFAPSFLFATLIEFLPLQPPSEGWTANWVYWIRMFLSSVVLSFGIAIQTTILVPAASLQIKHAVLIAVGTSAGFILILIFLAWVWRFPVPFLILVGNPGWQVSRYFCLRLAIGAKKWREKPEIKEQISVARKIAGIQSTLILIYPVYNAVFLRLHGLAQVSFVLLLPVIKYFLKRLFARVLKGIPAASSFGLVAVELFDALYLFKCMQTAGSILSGAALITVDLIQNFYHLRNLRKLIQQVRQNLSQSSHESKSRNMLLGLMNKSVSKPHSVTRLQSPSLPIFPSIAVTPAPFSGQEGQPEADLASVKKMKLEKSVQVLLLECEHIVVAEFIECVAPMFYALYMAILFQLPNAEYYPEMRHIGAAKLAATVGNIALYATLEFISLLYMHFLLQRNFNISALHLLASVLERENAVLQSIVMGWVIIVLQFTLEHGGVDYSFKFM